MLTSAIDSFEHTAGVLGLAETLTETVVCKVQVGCVCLGGGGEGVLVCDSVNCLLTLGGLGQQGLILSTPTGLSV